MEGNRHREALQVATVCIRLADSPLFCQRPFMSRENWVQVLGDLISSPGSTPLIKANAISLRIRHADGLVPQGRLDELRTTAMQIFEDEGHVHGAIDLRIHQAGKGIEKDRKQLTDELADELKGYFRVYEANNAIDPYHRAVQTILASL